MFVSNTAGSGYKIDRSLRLRAAASASLTRTFGTATDQKKWTLSGWFKVSSTGVGLQANNGTAAAWLGIGTNGITLTRGVVGVSIAWNTVTAAIFRDPSAWYHAVWVFDSTQAVAADRVKVYVNGSQVTTSGSYPSLNEVIELNAAMLHTWFNGNAIGSQDGYLSDAHFIDGQALTPASFGQIDHATNQWLPKKYTGTYGTNGFYLPFDDITSTTTLGYDKSGNGSNWTCNNVSLTAGPTYDSTLDVPGLPWGDGGNGRGNYATLNPLAPTGATYSDGNLKVVSANSTAPYNLVNTVALPQTGQWHAEVKVIKGVNNPVFGIGSNVPDSYFGYRCNGTYIFSAGSSTGTPATLAGGEVVGIDYDADAHTLTFTLNGVAQPGGITGIPAGDYFFMCRKDSASGDGGEWNFGQRPFAYAPPTGFKAQHTGNLPAPAIKNPADHFNVVLATGANIKTTAEALYPGSFLEWIKDRANVNNHQLIDTVRGTSAVLQSNTPGAETTYAAPAGSSVGWVWKAGGAAVANNAGSIASQVSANTTAGFSVVTYTGTGAAGTAGHGLGIAPKLIINKPRQATVTDDAWRVYHEALGATKHLKLNATDAEATATNSWNNTAPTSSVLSVGTVVDAKNYVAYCFAEVPGFSKFGSYTGNGSADGPFVFCGFRPRWLLIKRTTGGATDWFVVNTAGSPENVADEYLSPNLSAAEGVSSLSNFDILSGGFKLRTAQPDRNGASESFIFAAFAEAPFQYANAR